MIVIFLSLPSFPFYHRGMSFAMTFDKKAKDNFQFNFYVFNGFIKVHLIV